MKRNRMQNEKQKKNIKQAFKLKQILFAILYTSKLSVWFGARKANTEKKHE